MVEGKIAFLISKGKDHNGSYGIYLECCIGLGNDKLWIGFIWIRDHGEFPPLTPIERDVVESFASGALSGRRCTLVPKMDFPKFDGTNARI